MALIVEDGSGKLDSESYISVADCTTYCTAHGLTAWTGTDAAKETALRNATSSMKGSGAASTSAMSGTLGTDIAAGVMRAGDNRRHRGEDLAIGKPALRAACSMPL